MLLSGQWRVNRVISAPVERSNGYITQSSRASCSKYMGYIKNCNHIIFYSKLLTLCSRISFIEFRQKCVYNSAIHTWYSCPCCPCGNVPFYDVKQIKSTSPELLCLTFKIHPQESNLHKAALIAISSDVITQSTGGHCIRKPGPAVQLGLASSERWTRGSECVSLALPEHQQGFTIITLFVWGKWKVFV